MSSYNDKMRNQVDQILQDFGSKKDKVNKNKKGTWYKNVNIKCFNIAIFYHFSYVRIASVNKNKTGVIVVDNKNNKVHVQHDAFEILNEATLLKENK